MQLRSASYAFTALGIASLTLLGGGCSADGGSPMTNSCRPPTCTPAKSSYAAEVVSVASNGPPSVEFSDLILDDASGYFVLSLATPATVSGHVTSGGQPVPCNVVFLRPSRILGRPDVSYSATVDTGGEYKILLPPNLAGEQYLVRVQPTDTALYPPTATTLHVEGDMALDVSLASGDQLAVLKGTIKDVVDGPIGAARVVLRDAVTLLDVSTAGVTSANGSFAISMPLGATALSSSLVLVIERGDETTGLLSMTVELKPDQVQAELIDAALALTLPTLQPPSHLTFGVTGAATNGTDQPVAGARVLLRTVLVDTGVLGTTRATHEVEAQTDLDGQFSVDLYSDETGSRVYTMIISPPDDSDFQSTTSTITVGAPSGHSTTVKLPTRPLVYGRVLDPAGVALKGAVVQPTVGATLAAASSSLATTAKTSSATTDADGRFALRVDVGSYELGIAPPASSRLPRRWLPAQSIDHDLDLRDLSTPMAIEFDGVVVDMTTTPLRNADGSPLQSSVRLYLVPAGNSACDKDATGCLVPPRLQAEGTTNKDGRAALLLAADGT